MFTEATYHKASKLTTTLGLDHRRRSRRRRLSPQQRRRTVHGTLCSYCQRPSISRRRLSLYESRDLRRPRLWAEQGPHTSPALPFTKGRNHGTPAWNRGNSRNLRWHRYHERTNTGVANSALLYGRHTDELSWTGAGCRRPDWKRSRCRWPLCSR